jgi:hypothetical protein
LTQGKWGTERFGHQSRYPLEALEFLSPRHGLFGSYWATCQIGDWEVRMVNVHLMPVVLRRGSRLTDVLQTLTTAEQTHATEINQIVGVD